MDLIARTLGVTKDYAKDAEEFHLSRNFAIATKLLNLKL